MRIPTLVALALVTLSSGCWPYLADPYEDYLDTEAPDTADPDTDEPDPDTDDPDTDDPDTDDPDTDAPDGDGPTVVGWVSTAILMGDYWQEPNAVTLTGLIGLAAPDQSYSYVSSWPARGSCSIEASPGPDLVALTSPRGLPSTLNLTLGGRTVGLPTDADVSHLRNGGIEFSGSASFNSSVTSDFTATAGRFNGTLTRTPSNFTVTSPAMDVAGLTPIPLEPFDVAWTGASGDDVIVTVIFADEDFNALDGTFCTALGSSVSIDPDDFDIPGAMYAQIDVERVRTYSGAVGGSAGGTSRVVGLLKKTGLVVFGEP